MALYSSGKTAIVRRARALGFDACRVTTAAAPDHGARFREWLAAGRHGEMTYLARSADQRVSPTAVLPAVQSVITLAASYATLAREAAAPDQEDPATAGCPALPTRVSRRGQGNSLVSPDTRWLGRVARYARIQDYHGVLGPPLQALADYVDKLGGPGARSRWYVDTGPILERDLAQRAGLGFIGKHTNLINRRHGNWIIISEVLTTVALEPDAPEPNRCGRCARCLEACPTHALVAPFQLDARRCISYLTIENRGPIPVELRPAIGSRIFGCDDCLEVCPWNRFARTGRLLSETRWTAERGLGVEELLALDETAFRQRFGRTPLARAKHRGLRRNVCVALGNVADARALPALERVARESEPLVAEHARWAIGQIEAVLALARARGRVHCGHK